MWNKIAIAAGAGAILIGGGAAAVAAAASADTSGSGIASSPSASPSSRASAPAKPGHPGRGLRLGGALGRFEHAEWVSKDGTANVTHDAIHGTVSSVSPTSISVKASDGYTLTFTVTADTKVRVRDTSSTGKRAGKAYQ